MIQLLFKPVFLSWILAFTLAIPHFAKAQVLWDNWYTITVSAPGEKLPYAYYNEKVETLEKGRIRLQSHLWKKEEGFINEENYAGFAENTPDLNPILFNLQNNYRTTELKVDGTISADDQLTVKVIRGGQSLPVVHKKIKSKTLLASLFPIWLGKKIHSLKTNSPFSLFVLHEDHVDQGFPVVPVRLMLLKPDALAQETHTHKIQVDFEDLQQIWWVKDSGAAVCIELPLQKTLVKQVSREQALKFLK